MGNVILSEGSSISELPAAKTNLIDQGMSIFVRYPGPQVIDGE